MFQEKKSGFSILKWLYGSWIDESNPKLPNFWRSVDNRVHALAFSDIELAKDIHNLYKDKEKLSLS